MELKDRKAIANGTLPKFNLGLSNLSGDMMEKLKIQNISTNPGGALNFAGGLEPKLTTSALGLGSLGSGGMASAVEKDPTKFFGLDGASGAAKSGGAGAFLKNNAGGIMNIASTGIDFFSTLGDVSKNKMTSDQMMGSGGLMSESANGISYQLSKVDQAGILNQIDATAKAGTMASMGKGAALGGAIGSVIPGLGTVAGGVIGGVVGGIAGLFGSSKARREAERQKKIAIDRTTASNTQNREMAYTIGLRNEFNRENRTDTSQSLFHAALGVEDIEKDVDPRKMRTKHKHLVDTAEHGVVLGFGDSFGSEGETMISGKADKNGMHKVHRIRRGPNDTALMNLKKRDTVGSRFFTDYETGLPIADAIYLNALAHGGKISTEDKQRYEMNLNVERMMKEAGRRKTNLLPGFLGGTNKYKLLPGYFTGTPPYGKVEYLDDEPTDIVDQWQKDGSKMALQMFGGATAPGYKDDFVVPYSTKMNDLGTGTRQYKDPLYKSPLTGNAAATNRISSPLSGATSAAIAGSSVDGNAGAKKPGLFGKIKGVLGGLGGDIDLGNIALLGNAILTADQRTARAEGLRTPKSSVDNQFEQDAIQSLNKIHPDYYPVWSQNREIEGRGKFSIAQSGGLSAGQKMAGYMGLANSTQRNNAEAFFNTQEKYNAWKAYAAKAALEAGNQSATRKQQAYQWDEDMLAKAHAAQDNMFETSAYDRQNGLTQFFKNLWEKNQFDRTMNLYESQQKDDRAKTLAIINSLGTKNTPVTLNGVAGNASMLQVDPTTGKFIRTNPFSASQLLTQGTKKSIDNTNSIMNAATNIYNNAINNAKKVAKPKVTKRRTVKRGGKK